MANIKGDIRKLKRGELVGNIATAVCGIGLVYFVVCFAVSRALGIKPLELAVLISAPVLIAAAAAVAAYCNVRYGGAIDRAVKNYILDVFVENAALMHPEKKSLGFYICAEDSAITLQVNGFKENIVFDFSEFGKLSLTRKASIANAVQTRLCVTFCRLYGRGAQYTDVTYASAKKPDKTVFIIKDGSPDKKAYKTYIKNR